MTNYDEATSAILASMVVLSQRVTRVAENSVDAGDLRDCAAALGMLADSLATMRGAESPAVMFKHKEN